MAISVIIMIVPMSGMPVTMVMTPTVMTIVIMPVLVAMSYMVSAMLVLINSTLTFIAH